MICDKCRANIPDTATFCPRCGTKVEIKKAQDVQTKKCPSCGAENPASARFCKVDGYNFQQAGEKLVERPMEEGKPLKVLLCPKCGTSYPLTAKFCKKDGTPLEKVSHVAEIKAPDIPEKEMRPDAIIESKVEPKVIEAKAEEKQPQKVPDLEKPKDFIICPKCGTTNPLTARFCRKDGTPLKEDVEPSLVPETKPQVSAKPTARESVLPEAEIRKKAIRKTSRIRVWITVFGLVLMLLGAGSYLYLTGLLGKNPEKIQEKINTELTEKQLNAVSAQISKEWVATVSGIVSEPSYKSNALDIVRSHKELKKIIDNIKTIGEIEKEINKALKDRGIEKVYANLDGNLIATLRGFVNNNEEKERAINTARAYKELKDLKDEIQIKTIKIDIPSIENELNKTFRNRGLGGIYAEVNEDLVAILRGAANSQSDKILAVNIARSYKELKDVKDNIHVVYTPPPPPPPPPVVIANLEEKINMAFKKGGLSDVYAEVDKDNAATLKGFVNNKEEMANAINIARSYRELKSVRSNIQVKVTSLPPPPSPIDAAKLEGEINRALRNGGIKGVTAEVNDDLHVTLKGSVSSRTEKDRAFEIAKTFRDKGAKGIRDIIFVVEQ